MRAPGRKEESGRDGGFVESMIPENSVPRVKGGVWREVLFWCFPRAWVVLEFSGRLCSKRSEVLSSEQIDWRISNVFRIMKPRPARSV